MAAFDFPLMPTSDVPWSTSWDDFLAEAADSAAPACCLFSVDGSIPEAARAGYAALVIAYTRNGEPVTLLEDGSALLLVRQGGVASARVVSERVLAQLQRLHLETTVRVVFTAMTGDVPDTVERLQAAAVTAVPGQPTEIA